MIPQEYKIRKAEKKDTSFLIRAIIEADKSGKSSSSYCNLLSISENEFCEIIENIFEEELEDVEFGFSSFYVVTDIENKPIAACSVWIEGENGIPSWQQRMMALRSFCRKESIEHMLSLQDAIKGFMPNRVISTVQLESVFVDPNYRGQGIVTMLLNFIIDLFSKVEEKTVFEVMTYSNNQSAINLYTKLGFEDVEKTLISSEIVNSIYSSKGMIKFEKKINL
jgi:ribosomal protein S18 acetylase RimI-like enzyme